MCMYEEFVRESRKYLLEVVGKDFTVGRGARLDQRTLNDSDTKLAFSAKKIVDKAAANISKVRGGSYVCQGGTKGEEWNSFRASARSSPEWTSRC